MTKCKVMSRRNEGSPKGEIKQNVRIANALERIANNMEVGVACKMDIPLNLTNVVQFGAYYQGVLMTLCFVRDNVLPMLKGEDKVYMEATFALATKSKDNARRLLERKYVVNFRNHEKDKKGKVVKCEAYFAKRVTRYEEVI